MSAINNINKKLPNFTFYAYPVATMSLPPGIFMGLNAVLTPQTTYLSLLPTAPGLLSFTLVANNADKKSLEKAALQDKWL